MPPRSNKVEPAVLDRITVHSESTLEGLESEQILKVSEGTRNTQETLVCIFFILNFFPLSFCFYITLWFFIKNIHYTGWTVYYRKSVLHLLK